MKILKKSLMLLSIAFISSVLFSSCGDDEAPTTTLLINTKDDLIEFCELINAEGDYNAILMDNIDLEGEDWTPIGDSSSSPFCGTFDGKGHTISNLTISSVNGSILGLFGHVNGGTVANLTLENPQVSGSNYIGAVCGRIYNDGSIFSCHVKGGSVSGSSRVGGVIGYFYALSSSAQFYDCSNTSSVTGEDYTGGVIGYFLSYEDTPSVLSGCYNEGEVTGSAEYIGGIIGRYASSTSSTKLTLIDCYNAGAVTGSSNYVGGVAGSSNFASVIGCYNIGNIAGLERVGGVVGYASYDITACYNTGDVSGIDRIGGVAGSLNKSVITGCYNTGSVLGSSNLGGVAGYVISSTANSNYFVDQLDDNATYGIGNSESNVGASNLAATSDLNTSTVVDAMNSAITAYSTTITNRYIVGTTTPQLTK